MAYPDKKEVEPIELNEEEMAEYSRIIQCLNHAYRQRQQTYAEFDDMTYDQWYVANKKAASGYIPPKINRQDIRTVSGTTREKTNTFMSAILRYNFTHAIEAFNEEDIPDLDLGTAMTDLVTKSRLLESPRYDMKRPLYLQELVTQGTAFIREKLVEYQAIHKVMEGTDGELPDVNDMFNKKWKEVPSVIERTCDTELIPGRWVYLGNIREFFLEKQPFIGIRRQISRVEAKSLYGKWPRWKHVPYLVKKSIDAASQDAFPYDGFYMVEIGEDMVEEITFYDKWNNCMQILLNGIPQLKVGFALEFLYGRIEYPIVKGDLEPISSNFAYSRGIPAKTKFNQAFYDEMVKAVVLKTRMSYKPPYANNTGKILNKKIFWPGTVHNNIDPAKLQPIGDTRGVSGPEFQAMQFIKQLIDESSVNSIFEGQASKGDQTAREVMELQKQTIMKMGLSIYGIINMETELVWKRLYNILAHWTDPVDSKIEDTKGQIKQKKLYRTETVDSEFENGSKGKRIIQFTDKEMPHTAQVMAEEKLLSAKHGVPVRKIYLSAEELKSIKYRFFVKITPNEKDPSELRAAMFEESLMKALQIFPDTVNKEYAQEQWAIHQKMNPEKLFIKPQPQMPPQMPGMPPGTGQNPLGAQMLPQVTQKNKPSLKMMQGAA